MRGQATRTGPRGGTDFTFNVGRDRVRGVRATNWEFKNRALLFGLPFAVGFPLYALDRQNSTAALANWLGARLHMDADASAGNENGAKRRNGLYIQRREG